MSRKKWLIPGIIGIVVCFCIVPAVSLAIYLFRPALLNPFMPVYDYKIVPSVYAGYMRHTLALGNQTYESDYTEYGLTSPGNDRQIGQTSQGARLYHIYGQDNFFVLYDFMSPVAVFRDSRQPAFDLGTAGVTDMLLAPLGLGPQKSTNDPRIIQDVISTLTDRAPAAADTGGSLDKYCLYLSGGKLIGMQYCVGMYMDKAGQVLLARDTVSKELFQASPLVSGWAKSP